MESSAFEFADLKGETLVKAPGSINGESLVLRNLEGCTVYILDYSQEVEITNCASCQMFIGPVDGPAIFDGCSNCQVAVACQQFQAKGCTSCEFGLYCATQPSISNSMGITIRCWAGAYPGLSGHFASANLDPKSNHWNKVYDASAVEDGQPNYTVDEQPASYWEVPLEGAGACENPVPGPNGEFYQAAPAPAAHDAAAFFETAPEAAAPALPPMENGGGALLSDDFLAAGGEHVPSNMADTVSSGMLEPSPADGEHPSVTAAKSQLQQRLEEQSRVEAQKKSELQAAASQYLESFYQARNQGKEERIKAMREALQGQGNGEAGPEGDNEWSRAVSMIDFNLTRPNGSDLSRFKSVLMTLKAKETAA